MRRLITSSVCALIVGCTPIKQPAYDYQDRSTWQAVRFGGVVKQDLDFSCGLTSLATIFKYHFDESSITEKILLEKFIEMLTEEELLKVYSSGASIQQLSEIAKTYGYLTRLVKPSFEELKTLTNVLPAIVYLETSEFKHFAVVRGIGEYQVLLADSARGNIRLNISEFKLEWRKQGTLIIAKNIKGVKNRLLFSPDPEESQSAAELMRSVILR